MLASKMYESYILDWLKEEVGMRTNQFGGVKGLGTDHALFLLWQTVLEDLEDYRAATVITSLDYSKAFNRMSFQECLKALANKGASSGTIALVATFLTNRTMSVKVGSEFSRPREVCGGCPQGSILGVFLSNATIDDIEAGCEDVEQGKDKDECGNFSTDESDLESEDDIDSGAPAMSTPSRRPPTLHSSLCVSPVVSGCKWKKGYMRKLKKRPKRLQTTSAEGRQLVPHEPNHRTEAKWLSRLAKLIRFVDDGFSLSKINFENSYGFLVNSVNHRVKHAIQSQNIFRHMIRRTEALGMRVNKEKTSMICVSDALAYEADAFLLDEDGGRIGCQKTLKALGMRFSNRPNMNLHVEHIRKTFRSRYWTLRNLKRNGFNQAELVQVYKSMIRSVADYGAVVYHSSLTGEQNELLERCQNHALKSIFGYGMSARRMREEAGLITLRERRVQLCDRFARKLASSDAFEHLFPKKVARSSRRSGKTEEIYLEKKARCNRLMNSPLFYFRRRLNGKIGKNYGSRNANFDSDPS